MIERRQGLRRSAPEQADKMPRGTARFAIAPVGSENDNAGLGVPAEGGTVREWV